MKKRSLLLSPPGGAQPDPLAAYTSGGVHSNVLNAMGMDRGGDVLRTWLVAHFIADSSIDGGKYDDPSLRLPGARPHQFVGACPLTRGGRVSHSAGEYADWRSVVTMRALRCPRTTGGTGP